MAVTKQNLKQRLEALGCTSSYQLQKATGLNERTALRLWGDSSYIPRDKVMAKLFDAYGLQPGQYLYIVPDQENDPVKQKSQQKAKTAPPKDDRADRRLAK